MGPPRFTTMADLMTPTRDINADTDTDVNIGAKAPSHLDVRVLHAVNYGWPWVDGYTVRTMGLVTAQRRNLGLDTTLAVSPFRPFAQAGDRAFTLPGWGPDHQVETGIGGAGPASWERPSVGLSPRSSGRFRHQIAAAIRAHGCNLVHAHHPHFVAAAALRVARQHGLPFVYEVRCFNGDYDLVADNAYQQLRGRWRNALEFRIARRADAVVTISQGLADRLIDGGIPEPRVHVVRNSVPAAHFTYRPAPPVDPASPLTVGYATTFEAIEGLDLFVEAFADARQALAERGRTLRAVLAGVGRDRDRIGDLVAARGLTDAIDLPGFVPYGRMPACYGSLDLFVVPRRSSPVTRHTTPLKPLEALAIGVPVLCSDLPALRELLGGRDGVRFAAPERQAFTQGMLDFAAAPWHVPDGVVDDRSWSREVVRYEAIYADARGHQASRGSHVSRNHARGSG